MNGVLAAYLDLWARVFWPLRKTTDVLRPYWNRVRIWLLSDIANAVLLIVWVWVAGFYAVAFSFAPPTSYYLLGAAFTAVLARYYARRRLRQGSVLSGFAGEIASMTGWVSVGLVIVTGVQVWLNLGGGLSPARFATIEAAVIDRTATLRRYASTTNVLWALAGLLTFALLFRTLKPVVAFGAVRKSVSALLAVAAVVTSFTFVASSETGARHDRIVNQIAPRMRDNAAVAASARRETAAMRWAAAELALQPKAARARLLQEIAALEISAIRLCDSERAAFSAAYDAAQARASGQIGDVGAVVAAELKTRQVAAFCAPDAIARAALKPAVRTTAPAPVAAPADDWIDDLLTGPQSEAERAILHSDVAREAAIPVRDLQALDASYDAAAREAVQARKVVRDAVLNGLGDLLGPQYKGFAGAVLNALQGAVLDAVAVRAETGLAHLWTPKPEVPPLTEELVAAPAAHTQLVTLTEAHPSPSGHATADVADDIAAQVWKTLRPSGGAAEAASVAVAAIAARQSALRAGEAAAEAEHGVHGKGPRVRAPEVPHFRIPRI